MTNLDHAFLRHFGISADSEIQAHAYYLPFFQDHHRILELGSGMGGFVKMLCDGGKDAYGIDSDPGCVEASKALGIPAVEADVLEHLQDLEPDSLDAIFSAHLVEHLPYETVLELIRLSHRGLRPGGRLLLVTPNPRGLISHLEFYYQHFGHVSFFQPELLSFFMEHCGFGTTRIGENPDTRADRIAGYSPLAQIDRHLDADTVAEPGALSPESVLPSPNQPLRRLVRRFKLGILRWLVQPFTDQLAERDHALSRAVRRNAAAIQTLHQVVDRPFECYAIGDKTPEENTNGTRVPMDECEMSNE